MIVLVKKLTPGEILGIRTTFLNTLSMVRVKTGRNTMETGDSIFCSRRNKNKGEDFRNFDHKGGSLPLSPILKGIPETISYLNWPS